MFCSIKQKQNNIKQNKQTNKHKKHWEYMLKQPVFARLT